jgi:4-amino-4-deoxy-L-arabinose transferase-like glycosyltransferase
MSDPSVPENPAQEPSRGERHWWIPALLLLLFAAQSLWFIKTQSLTYDEPAHIVAGVEAWQQGRFEHWNDHPPLGRLWLTLPLIATPTDFKWSTLNNGFVFTAMTPGPETLAWRTRPMNTLLGLALGLSLWLAARKFFSTGAANVALALYAFTPSLIANFSIATTDGIGALFIFAVACQLVRWRRNPVPVQMVLLGLALGGLLLTKFYAPPLVLLAVLLMLVLDRDRGLLGPRRWNWKPVLAALGIALLTLWAGYFFHVAHLKIGNGQVEASFPNRLLEDLGDQSRQVQISGAGSGGRVPGRLARRGVQQSPRPPGMVPGEDLSPGWHQALLSGRHCALKWPTILLLLFFASLLLGVRKSCRAPGDLLILCLFAVGVPGVRRAVALRHRRTAHPAAVPFRTMLIAGGIWERARQIIASAVAFVILALCPQRR